MLALSRLSRPLQDLVNQGHAWPKTSVSPGKAGADTSGPWLPNELLHPTTAVANMLLEAGGGVYALQLLTPSLQHLAAMVSADTSIDIYLYNTHLYSIFICIIPTFVVYLFV